jgi:ArsR family transcriptional regulator
MPMLQEPSEAPRIGVRPSAALELMWLLHNCGATHPLKGSMMSLEALRQKFQAELRSFHGDGVNGATESVVLAQRSGTLFDLDLDRFFERLEATAEAGGEVPTLLSETPSEQRAINERLRRLQADPVLRGRYRELLQWVWEAARAEWESEGKASVAAATAEWNRLLDEGTSFRTLLDRPRIWPGRPELDELADSAAAEGRLVLSPGWYFGEIHVVEIDGTLYMGRGVRTQDQEAFRRETATRVAGNLKALADPTRLGILLWLAKHPASVTEVANHFDLAQPTVSGHVQLLRDAGLLEDKLAGRRSKLVVARDRLKGLMGDAEESMLRLFPHEAGR